MIAIERAGMAADGNYYNARKVNIKHLVDPIDELFIAAQTLPGITTTGTVCVFSFNDLIKVLVFLSEILKTGSIVQLE